MRSHLSILAVGSPVVSALISDVLDQSLETFVWPARSHADLVMHVHLDRVELAVVEALLPLSEVIKSTEHIRHTWPLAVIVIVGPGAEYLDDWLYDHHFSGPLTPHLLDRTLKQIASKLRDS